jgi:hypothetical protein
MINLALATMTVLSVIVAAIATAVAWTAKRDEQQRAAARIALLAAAIHDGEDDLPLRPPASSDERTGLLVEPLASSTRRLAVVGVVGVLVVGAITGLVLVAESGSRGVRAGQGALRQAHVALELVALEHDRDDSRFVVRGIVHNPASAATLRGLTAVVLVFSREGEFIASGRAPVATPALAPGAETPFVVTLPDADSVDRYRVSFRLDDQIVPHVDRRGRNAGVRPE